MRWLSNYKIVFSVYLVFFGLVILGIIPRESVIYATILLSAWVLLVPIEEGTLFFISSIPILIAIPFSESFDSLNMWRVFSIILFSRFLFRKTILENIYRISKNLISYPIRTIKEYPITFSLVGLFILSSLSILWAPHASEAIKRVIYFTNLSLIGFTVLGLRSENNRFSERLFGAINISLITVVAVATIQIVSTYLIDIYQFMRIWGEGIQCNQFGNTWCYIAVNVGNTWFAYYGEQLSLRVFSLFPDSHSFPVFALLGIPALFALTTINGYGLRFWQAVKTRMNLWVLLIPIVFLAIILSGTRGIWAGAIGVPFVALILAYTAKRKGWLKESSLIGYLGSYMAIFFLLFLVAFPIFSSPQFLLSKGDNDILRHRIRSIIDFGETSNSQRLEIWKQSWEFIKKEPLTGIGIGNYPLVLNQKVELAKAGSTAHNIYLHVWSEIGVVGLVLLLFIFWKVFHYAWLSLHQGSPKIAIYSAGMLLVLPWIYAYLMTDPILFDERVFLYFSVAVGLLVVNKDQIVYGTK